MIVAAQTNLNAFLPEMDAYQTGTDFVCRIRFGNLLKDSGDIFLCPIGDGFLPSNPLAHWVVEKEGKWLKEKLQKIRNSSENNQAVFLPCRKLKYRGIIFAQVDFHSSNKIENNKKRMAEALCVAQRYNCVKLSCPENFLYDSMLRNNVYDLLFLQLHDVLKILPETKINFMVDFIVKTNIQNLIRLKSSGEYYDFSKAYFEKLPLCSEILPWYRKRIRDIRRPNSLSSFLAYRVRSILTNENISSSKIKRVLNQLHKRLGDYYETGVNRYNEGYEQFLLELCKEMPWNKERIESEINKE
ncbi:MAG: hypothetical protein J6Y16_11680 [Treponema sp.]|nr:hypothetical protein [Treponema sp.]